MGSRSTNVMGLSAGGEKFLNQFVKHATEQGVRIYSDGSEELFKRAVTIKTLEYDDTIETYGMFDEYPYIKYTAADGKIFTEYTQASYWDSGPVIFLALKDGDGNPIPETLWTKEELEKNGLNDSESLDDNEEGNCGDCGCEKD